MTIAAVSALVGGMLCLSAAAMAMLLVEAVPEWRDGIARFRWIALTAGAAALCNVPGTVEGFSADTFVWCTRLQLLFLCLHGAAWVHDIEGRAGHPATERAGVAGFAVAGVLPLLPGLVTTSQVSLRPVRWLGVVYREPHLTPFGVLFLAAAAIAAALLVWRALRYPDAVFPRLYRAAAWLLLVLIGHDAAVAAGAPFPDPYLLDFGFGPVILIFTGLVTQHAARDVRALRDLQGGLERAVQERTRQLETAQERLLRAERLAALGQFSAAVAHEVNNPAAVIGANLDYLAVAVPLGTKGTQAVDESRTALERIVRLTRQLLQAGRTAASGVTTFGPVQLAAAAQEAIRAAVTRHGRTGVEVRYEGGGLTVRADPAAVVQVITNLVANAMQAIPDGRGGQVRVRAEPDGHRGLLLVEDDGAGMSEETLRHIFEPFYSTKPRGAGTGLGLAVSRSLVIAMGGELSYESVPGRGTRAKLSLMACEAAAELPPPPTPPGLADGMRRLRILVVDDDAAVRGALVRVLGARHEVDEASSVGEALAAIPGGPHDLILCDVMMPDGGGERIWREVSVGHPDRAGRIVFLTGGAATPESRAFLSRQPRPVLEKPLDLEALRRVTLRLGIA